MIALEIFLELGEESADERRRKLVFLNTADIHVQEVFAQMPNVNSVILVAPLTVPSVTRL